MTRLTIAPVVWLLAAVWPLASGVSHAADERAALAELRQEAERRYAAEQAACAQKFAVTSCSEQARLRRRDELVALQKAQAALESRERRATIENRRVAAVQPPGTASAASAGALRALRPSRRADPAPIEPHPAPRAGTADRSAQERRARQAHDQRQREADTHRKMVEARNAARAASAGQRSAPLPTPLAAPAR